MKRHANPRQDQRLVIAGTEVGRRCRLTARAPSRRLQRGSALILTIVCLVMMVLLGTAYIQIARIDRRVTRQLTAVNNMNTVRDAVIEYIQKVLREDLIKTDAGGFFNPAEFIEDYDYPFTNASAPGYSIKRVVPNGLGAGNQPGDVFGTAVGGQFDDTWLASSYIDPESGAQSPRWPHISNLNGVYLHLPKSGVGNPQYPLEVVTGNRTSVENDGLGEAGDDSTFTSKSNAVIATDGTTSGSTPGLDSTYSGTYEKRGVDTDGDGILDARWTWAPNNGFQIGDRLYVVAYRIIDLSSMIDVNVATGLATDGWAASTNAQGYFPTDLNLVKLMHYATRNGGSGWPGASVTEFGKVMTFRGLPTTLPTPPGTANLTTFPTTYPTAGRAKAWVDNVRYYGFAQGDPSGYGFPINGGTYPDLKKFTADDELEIRARGGLNTDVNNGPLETALSSLLRSTVPQLTEASYANVQIGGAASDPHAYSHGARNIGPSDTAHIYNPGITYDKRRYPEVRHMMTTMAGASAFAPRYTNMTAADSLQVDLVYRNSTSNSSVDTTLSAARIAEFRDRLSKLFRIGTPKYLNLTDDTQLEQIAAEFALAIHDYSDGNNRPGTSTVSIASNGYKFYGMERLPFLREAYFQVRYKAADTNADTTYDQWQYEPGTAAVAIELGNPFDKPIKFADTKVRLRLAKGTPAAPNDMMATPFELPSDLPDLPARAPGGAPEQLEQLVLFSNALNADNLDVAKSETVAGAGKGADIEKDLAFDTLYGATFRKDMGKGIVLDANLFGGDLLVMLEVQAEDGTWVVYDRLTVGGVALQNTRTGAAGTVTVGVPEPRAHDQVSLLRDGQGTRYLSNLGKNRGWRGVAGSLTTGDYKANNSGGVSKIGYDSKGITGETRLDTTQIPNANHQIFNVAELGYIFMFGFYDGSAANDYAGDFPTRMLGAGSGNEAGIPNAGLQRQTRWFLSFSTFDKDTLKPATGEMITPSSTQIPHMEMVFDHFTALSPRWDKLDNDNVGGADNPEEQFIPGRMNVNTAPWWLLAMACSVPEPSLQNSYGGNSMDNYFSFLGIYRDSPQLRTLYTKTDLSKRIVREKDKGLRSIGELINPHFANAADLLNYGYDNLAIGTTDIKRLYPNRDSGGQFYNAEYLAQERLVRFHYMNSHLTTRSDRFCAYVYIKEFSATAFNSSASDSTKFFILLDRSRVTNEASSVLAYPKTGKKNN